MIVLNSRDWSEIVWLLCFKNQPCNKLYPKNPLECIGEATYNDAVSWLRKLEYFSLQLILKILSVFSSASLP